MTAMIARYTTRPAIPTAMILLTMSSTQATPWCESRETGEGVSPLPERFGATLWESQQLPLNTGYYGGDTIRVSGRPQRWRRGIYPLRPVSHRRARLYCHSPGPRPLAG